MSELFLPPARVAFLDANGQISRVWLTFLSDLMTRVGGSNAADLTSVIALLAALTISVNDDKVNAAFDGQQAQMAELQKQIDDLRLELALLNQPITTKEDVYDSVFG